jgi:hypothetical protein
MHNSANAERRHIALLPTNRDVLSLQTINHGISPS